MLGVTIFIVYGMVGSISDILDITKETVEQDTQRQKEQIEFAIRQNREIIDALNNSTNLEVELIERQNLGGNQTIQGFNVLLGQVNDILLTVNETLSEQLLPVVATLKLQQKSELDHFNQTAIILDSIIASGNATREQAELISEARQIQRENNITSNH